TLSVDDTSDVIDALRAHGFLTVSGGIANVVFARADDFRKTRALAEQADVVLVVGSKNSSNSNRLAELAQRMGKAAYLIDDAS
ncbi:4-hydroxy-3-methylbut-2-enyl diphosphate reductase, partial [Klebsiella pneumoniae]|nr:4-hydroxy-3-methylbut-2-enyl diphosphate reductase [Klebsiella pneumoniae]